MDRAQRANEVFSDEALERHQRRRLRDRTSAVAATHCIDCDDAIDPRRRIALPDAQRCVECATRVEKHGE